MAAPDAGSCSPSRLERTPGRRSEAARGIGVRVAAGRVQPTVQVQVQVYYSAEV